MFGSKNLLIAFGIGVAGISLATAALADVDGFQMGLFLGGMTMIWVSALFGGFLAGREVADSAPKSDESGS